jgi:hypothetical protein
MAVSGMQAAKGKRVAVVKRVSTKVPNLDLFWLTSKARPVRTRSVIYDQRVFEIDNLCIF